MRVLMLTLLLHAGPAPSGTAPVSTQDTAARSPVEARARPPASTAGEDAVIAAEPVSPETRARLLRREVAQVALAQVKAPDAAWQPAQRDCAGLIRYAYRTAYRRVAAERLASPLWQDARGGPSDFADAESLISRSFVPLGRGADAREQLRTGDVVAFRQEHDAGPVFHLMLVVQPEDRAHAPARVVYHPGEAGARVRTGILDSLATEAPLEWRPVPANAAFLGFFRFKEWMS
ncbi:DUF1175 family protein [Corallococcus carmarthensis]|uniref:DUF1175 family protein n=1 Tax=Corallococcus carmarthensis TaxID=2316728 RepID=UPI00148CBB25|nr:DUF1175 family protein [Corallococcus carmarthensis]NOK22365.1 DUF1175 family protein [Corallococcus carmarthensis]